MSSTAATRSPVRRQTSVIGAYGDGWRRVLGAPALVLGVLAAGLFAFAAPPGLGGPTTDLIPRQPDDIWLVVHEAFGMGIGPAGPVPLADAWLDPVSASAAVVYLAFSTFLWGGVLDRLARQRRVGTGPFWAACGVYGIRFARLQLVVLAFYAAVFFWVFPAVLAGAGAVAGAGSNGVVLLGLSLLALLPLLALLGLVVEFARVRIVVEDRYSALGALAASMRFIRRRPARVVGLYAVQLAVAWALVMAATTLTIDPTTVTGWLVALLWLLLRTAARLASAAAAVSFFQGELAHAGYTASPIPMWPDSPTVEGLRNLRL